MCSVSLPVSSHKHSHPADCCCWLLFPCSTLFFNTYTLPYGSVCATSTCVSFSGSLDHTAPDATALGVSMATHKEKATGSTNGFGDYFIQFIFCYTNTEWFSYSRDHQSDSRWLFSIICENFLFETLHTAVLISLLFTNRKASIVERPLLAGCSEGHKASAPCHMNVFLGAGQGVALWFRYHAPWGKPLIGWPGFTFNLQPLFHMSLPTIVLFPALSHVLFFLNKDKKCSNQPLTDKDVNLWTIFYAFYSPTKSFLKDASTGNCII